MPDDGFQLDTLSRRERQIMQIVFRRGSATAAEVRAELPDAPSDSAVRTLLRVLEEKGVLRHRQEGPRYVYTATVERARAGRTALATLLRTFFDGSPERVVSALLDLSGEGPADDELERMARRIDRARREGR